MAKIESNKLMKDSPGRGIESIYKISQSTMLISFFIGLIFELFLQIEPQQINAANFFYILGFATLFITFPIRCYYLGIQFYKANTKYLWLISFIMAGSLLFLILYEHQKCLDFFKESVFP